MAQITFEIEAKLLDEVSLGSLEKEKQLVLG